MDLPNDRGVEQIQGWESEPWAIRMATDLKPAMKKGFLEHVMKRPYCPTGAHRFVNDPSRRTLSETRDWVPIVSLIASLDRLEQFDFIACNNFTTGLMEAFSHHHPYCKLNILERQQVGYTEPNSSVWNDDLLALDEHSPGWDEVDGGSKFDMNTLHLPGLHILFASLPQTFKPSARDQRLDELLPFLFTSPGLKHLCLEANHDVNTSRFDLLQAKWQNHKPKPVAQLESLTVSNNRVEGDLLPNLAAAGDFSQLRSLDVSWNCVTPRLANIAGLFPNLERLFIHIMFKKGPNVTPTYNEELIDGILAFRPLKYLDIRGLRDTESLDRIIQHHGASLKGLSLFPNRLRQYPRLSPLNLREMAIRCPNLEELRFQVTRSGGDQAECEIYKAFGHFHTLQKLFLDLDFDARSKLPPRIGNKITEDSDALRQIFINAAMDENLALQIWDLIKINNPNLKDLRLVPIGSERFAPDEHYLLFCLARSYLLTNYNLENPGLPVIEQIGKRKWEVKKAMGKTIVQNIISDGELNLSNRVASVLEKLWPKVTVPEQSDWWTCWTSFPLQADNEQLDKCSGA
ncbi:hypothetical protein N7540_011888 [Penicillium herquei]|nr:hypothetical protein N7540_011888 [Penicillium herquei]